MSEKNFCESGKHSYQEVDIVRSVVGFAGTDDKTHWIVVACSKCDSTFLREVKPLL